MLSSVLLWEMSKPIHINELTLKHMKHIAKLVTATIASEVIAIYETI